MPSIREKTMKTGNKFYEIRVCRGRGKSYLTTHLKSGASGQRRCLNKYKLQRGGYFVRHVVASNLVSDNLSF